MAKNVHLKIGVLGGLENGKVGTHAYAAKSPDMQVHAALLIAYVRQWLV